MTKHVDSHPLAGQTVKLRLADAKAGEGVNLTDGGDYRIEDYWDRVSGQSWMDSNGNWAAMNYAMRNGLSGLPLDNEVVYGKQGGLGHIVHVSELLPV